MSIKTMFAAMQVKTGSPITKLVLLKLADNANDKGECWPSHQTIADVCEMSVKTSQRHIRKLIELGLLAVEKRKGKKGNDSNLYTLLVDNFDKPIVTKNKDETESESLPPSDRESLTPSDRESPKSVRSFEPVNQSKSNVGFSNQLSVDQVYQYRKRAFEHFWKNWREAKKIAGTTNDAPKQKSYEKFNALFTVKQIQTKGKEWFVSEIDNMVEFAFSVHSDIGENGKASSYARFLRMMPEKFFSQKQWRDHYEEEAA